MAGMYFLSKNYINSDDTINVSSNDTLKSLAYDRLAATYWESTGETGEAGTYPVYYEIVFYEGSNAVSRVIDTLVLQYINLKAFKIQYWNGAAYVDFTGGVFTVNAAASLRIKLATPVTTSKIKIIMDSTIVANQEKKIGEVWALLETYLLTAVKGTRDRKDLTVGDGYRLADGILESWQMVDKWICAYNLEWVTDAELAALFAIFSTHASFTVYPDYALDINEIKLVKWPGNWRSKDDQKTFYHTVPMELQEI